MVFESFIVHFHLFLLNVTVLFLAGSLLDSHPLAEEKAELCTLVLLAQQVFFFNHRMVITPCARCVPRLASGVELTFHGVALFSRQRIEPHVDYHFIPWL